jgi:hypothetical protein
MIRRWNTGSWSSGSWNEVLPDNTVKHMKTVKTGVGRMTNAEVLELVNSIITGATGNADFATPNPTLVVMQALFDTGTQCLAAVALAETTLAVKLTERDNKFAEIRDKIAVFASWAVQHCAGDRVKLQSVGLDVRANATPVGPMPAPLNLRSFGGALEGGVDLFWDPVRGRYNYFLECGQSSNGPWTTAYTGRASQASCGGLTPGAEYFFRVRAQGFAGLGPWSDITKKRAS